MGYRLQYAPLMLLVRLIGALPRPLAHGAGMLLGRLVYHVHPRLRIVGLRNLQMAFPENQPPSEGKSCAEFISP